MDERRSVILIIDDNPQNLQLIGQRIEKSGYEAAVANNGKQAIAFAKEQRPSLILLDIMMPAMDGFEVCQILKDDPDTEDIPVIFLTAKSDYDDITKAFERGAVDYIIKPFNAMELNARVKTHLELRESRENLKCNNEKLEKTNQELKKANDIILSQNQQLVEAMKNLEIAAKTDPLTGLLNRRSIIEQLEAEIVRYRRSGKIFSVAIADIDFFKPINDQYGHDAGDFVLRSVSEVIRANIRGQDYVARWGGEEFIFLLPETDVKGAVILMEKLRSKFENKVYPFNDLKLRFTVTFGITEFDFDIGIDSSIKKADIALYYGKRNGRNQVTVYNEALLSQNEKKKN